MMQSEEAERLYRERLHRNPDDAEALQMLGMLAHRAGRSAEALELLSRAANTNPQAAGIHGNMGILLADMGKWDTAVASLSRAVELQPRSPELQYNYGKALMGSGRPAEAVAAYRAAVTLRPDFAEAYNNLGSARAALSHLDEAIVAFRRAIELKPAFAEAHNNLGAALQRLGRFDEAAQAYRRALELRPRYDGAIAGLSSALVAAGDLDGAIAYCQQVLAKQSESRTLSRNLGWAYKEAARIGEAIACYRKALAGHPDPSIHSDLLFTLHFDPGYDRRRLLSEHAQWAELYGQSLMNTAPAHSNQRVAGSPLRVGYVAHHLGDGPLGRFLLPLLANHDPEQVTCFCYCNWSAKDSVGTALRSHFQVWRETAALNDEQLAQLIRQDQIDILVDLNLHTNGNRLLTFARKPAPIQVTYLAYCSTTGLKTIDYRLTDPYLDPAGSDDQLYAEQSVRLKQYWCYPVPTEAPAVAPLPALRNGYLTFGSLNDFAKTSRDLIETWAAILRQVPRSRLILHAKPGRHREALLSQMAQEQVSPQRVEFAGRLPLAQYFDLYNRIDIALDPFVWSGGITSCDALWMGVPVVSFAGDRAVARGGLSILSQIGLPELAAGTVEQYVNTAVRMAEDLSALSALRTSMRARMHTSPLMDGRGFARQVETAYRQIWLDWCAGAGEPRTK